MNRPGGNFTQPDVDLFSHATRYFVFVGWRKQSREYETAQEAEIALHELLEQQSVEHDRDDWLEGQALWP